MNDVPEEPPKKKRTKVVDLKGKPIEHDIPNAEALDVLQNMVRRVQEDKGWTEALVVLVNPAGGNYGLFYTPTTSRIRIVGMLELAKLDFLKNVEES